MTVFEEHDASERGPHEASRLTGRLTGDGVVGLRAM